MPSYVILSDGEGVLFTGTGYYSVIEGMSTANFGTLTVPASGEYEVLFRYNLRGAAIWSTATLLIQAGSEEGSGPVDCRNTTELPLGNSEFGYTSWMMGMGLTISQTFCFRAGRPYTFILDDFDSGLADSSTAVLEIDSLILIPVHAPGLQVFSDPTLQMEYASCVDSWRSLQTQPSASSTCEQTTFNVLSEVYNGTLGKTFHICIACATKFSRCTILTSVWLTFQVASHVMPNIIIFFLLRFNYCILLISMLSFSLRM